MQFTPRNLSAPNLNLDVKDSVRNIAEITFRWCRARPEEISSRVGEHFLEKKREEIPANSSLDLPLSLQNSEKGIVSSYEIIRMSLNILCLSQIY